MERSEINFDSENTDPFPYDGQPLIVTPSPTATNKEENELQKIKKELYEFRRSPALFEFSDDEPTSPVQLDELRTMWEQVVRFEEASKKLAQAMTKNTACMKQLIDEKEASASRKPDDGKAEQKRSTPERCPDCGKIRRTKPQPTNDVTFKRKKIKTSPETENRQERPEPTAHDRFRPSIEAWLKRWMSDDEEKLVNVAPPPR